VSSSFTIRPSAALERVLLRHGKPLLGRSARGRRTTAATIERLLSWYEALVEHETLPFSPDQQNLLDGLAKDLRFDRPEEVELLDRLLEVVLRRSGSTDADLLARLHGLTFAQKVALADRFDSLASKT